MIRNTHSLEFRRLFRLTLWVAAGWLAVLWVAPVALAQDAVSARGEPSTPATDEAPAAEAPAANVPVAKEPAAPTPAAPAAPTSPASSPSQSASASSTTSFPPESSNAVPVKSAAQPASRGSTKKTAQPAAVVRAPPRTNGKPTASVGKQDTEPGNADTEPSPSNKESASKDDESSGDIIRIGPMVGVGLPNLLSFGGLLKLTRYLGGGINIGLIPTVRVSYYGQAKLNYQEYDVFGRLFPFGGGFFLGAGVGYETVKGTLSDKIDTSLLPTVPPGLSIPNPLTYESSGSVKTMVLTPQIGYLYTMDIGFSLGIDIGAQVPIAPSQIKFQRLPVLPTSTPKQIADQVNAQLVDPSDQKVKNTLQTIGRAPLPTINLRVGWLL